MMTVLIKRAQSDLTILYLHDCYTIYVMLEGETCRQRLIVAPRQLCNYRQGPRAALLNVGLPVRSPQICFPTVIYMIYLFIHFKLY